MLITDKHPFDWSGKVAYIIGGGPSIRGMDLSCLKDKNTLALNSSIKVFPWCKACYFMDLKWYENNYKLFPKLATKFVTCTNRKLIGDNPNVYAYREGVRYGIDERPDYLSRGNNSGYGGIAAVKKWGAALAVLLGYDMKVGEDGSHNHHKDYPVHPSSAHYKNEFLKKFDTILAGLGDLRVVNATPGSELKLFPQVELKDYI